MLDSGLKDSEILSSDWPKLEQLREVNGKLEEENVKLREQLAKAE